MMEKFSLSVLLPIDATRDDLDDIYPEPTAPAKDQYVLLKYQTAKTCTSTVKSIQGADQGWVRPESATGIY